MTVVRIAVEVTKYSDREFIQSKLMRNVILMILLNDLIAKYATRATLDRNSISGEKLRLRTYQPWLAFTVANNEQTQRLGREVLPPRIFSPTRW